MATLLAQGCAANSTSGAGDERTAQEERIEEQAIKEMSPKDPDSRTQRTSPSLGTEMTRDNATGPTTKGESIPAALMVVSFDFDQDSLRVDALPMLKANVRLSKEDSVTRVLPEGRGDERGTAVYNITLGERRARTLKSYLQQLGLSIDLRTTSYEKIARSVLSTRAIAGR